MTATRCALPLRAALFDLDGTIVDTEGQYSAFWDTIAKDYATVPDLATRIKGTTLTTILDTYFPSPARQQTVIARVNAFERQMTFPLVAGIETFIHQLKAHGVRCAIVTSSDKTKMTNAWRALPTLLPLFDSILTAEDFTASKPAPACYLTAAARLHVAPAHCVVFEDAPNGLAAGMSAGMLTIGVATTNSARTIAPLCHHVIDDYTQIDYPLLSRLLSTIPRPSADAAPL